MVFYTVVAQGINASHFNPLAPGRCDYYLELVIFKRMSRIGILIISYEIATIPHWSKLVQLGDGLVPSGNTSLSEPMLSQILAA